jgi:hypothetical protein
LTVIESDEAERAGQIRIVSLELIDGAERLGGIKEVGEHASVSIIHEKEAFHDIPLSRRPGF